MYDYNGEKPKFDIEIPIHIQAKIFADLLEHNPEFIVKEKASFETLKEDDDFSYRIDSYYMEDEYKNAKFIITITNVKENILYQVDLVIMKTGSKYGWEFSGYSQEKLNFLDMLITQYIYTLNKPESLLVV